MLGALSTAVSGLDTFQSELNVIGNNVANSNTIAFKSNRLEFEDTFSQTLESSNSITSQIGTGVGTGAISSDYSRGQLASTGHQGDMAIDGEGFFVVVDSSNNAQYVTRAGDFHVDINGYLVTNDGYRVQGFNDAGLSTVGDLKIDNNGADPAITVAAWSVDTAGKITVKLSDGTSSIRGQILLQSFTAPQALIRQGSNLFSGMDLAGPLGGAGSAKPAAPNTSGLGLIREKQLEQSNVDLASQFAELITAQRGFQANARMITTSDEVLQEIVGLKR